MGNIALASGGNNDIQIVEVHRQDCTMVTGGGAAVGTARFSLDDQGGDNVNPNGIEILASVTGGVPRTSYALTVVGASCQTLASGGTLTTDDRGRGDQEFHVLGSTVSPGTIVRLRLVAIGDALTSDQVSAP